MKIELQVVSGRTLDTEPCVMLICENQIYTFNVPDQTQRIYMENKWKMSKIKQFFLTDTSSSAIGGVPGLILTVTGGEKPNFGFSAPKKFESILRQQILYNYCPDSFPVISNSTFSDKFLTVEPIELSETTAYLVKLCDEPGKFDPKKAKELGLKPGPLFKKLTLGESVTLENGNIIEPSMCVGAPIPGSKILIVNCKSEIDIASLKSKVFSSLSEINFVVHFSKPEIVKSDNYQQIFNQPHLENKQICFMGNERVSFPTIFKLYSTLTNEKLPSNSKTEKVNNFVEGEIGLTYTFAPSNKQKFTNTIQSDKSEETIACPLPEFHSFAVTFLGTGCKQPTKYRNVTGILVHCSSGYIVLDAGEGFVGQLSRKYGKENAHHILKNLLFIWTSHSHGDHVYGVHNILEVHQKLTDKQIPVFADKEVIADLKERGDFNANYYDRSFEFDLENGFQVNEVSLFSFPVKHCEGSQGCVLEISGKWRIAFSGDHSIDDDFVEKVGKCDLLIHEATFSDDATNEAAERCHSTIGQAIEVGNQVYAKYIILTHISARYQNENINIANQENALFAYDYLSFSFENIEEVCRISRELFVNILKNENETE